MRAVCCALRAARVGTGRADTRPLEPGHGRRSAAQRRQDEHERARDEEDEEEAERREQEECEREAGEEDEE